MVGDFNVDSRAGAFDKKVLEDFPHLDVLSSIYVGIDEFPLILYRI